MAVSQALEHSASAFNMKYDCNFNFVTFEARVEEFTFLRPNGGWIDVYKTTFDRMYQKSLESAAMGRVENLNGEAMLDDFEYTLIRPYANERGDEIKHKPYAGMDRMTRLEYLDALTKRAPKNSVELYSEKYKNGEITLAQIKSAQSGKDAIEIAAYVQAIERVNQSRSAIWNLLHPIRGNAEKREVALMKKSLIQEMRGGEDAYRDVAKAACEPFEAYGRVNANLNESRARAREEMNRLQKMNDVMRESIRIEGFSYDQNREQSPRVDHHNVPASEKQI